MFHVKHDGKLVRSGLRVEVLSPSSANVFVALDSGRGVRKLVECARHRREARSFICSETFEDLDEVCLRGLGPIRWDRCGPLTY